MMPVTRYNGFRPHEVRPNTDTGLPNTFTGFPNTYTGHPNTYTGYAVGAALPGVASHPGGATSFTYRSPQGLKARDSNRFYAMTHQFKQNTPSFPKQEQDISRFFTQQQQGNPSFPSQDFGRFFPRQEQDNNRFFPSQEQGNPAFPRQQEQVSPFSPRQQQGNPAFPRQEQGIPSFPREDQFP